MPKKRDKRYTIGGIMDMLGKGIQDLTGAPDGTPGRILAEISPWIGNFTTHAAQKWLPFLTAGHSCTLPILGAGPPHPCPSKAIGACDACGRPACIHHAMVDQHGGICCYGCVGEVMTLKRRPGPGPAPATGDRRPPVPPDVAQARVTLALELFGLRPGVNWEVIEKRKRKLLAESHPDRKRGVAEKAAAERRYKAIGEAYMDLERFYKNAEAA